MIKLISLAVALAVALGAGGIVAMQGNTTACGLQNCLQEGDHSHCLETSVHNHDGIIYYGYSEDDGHRHALLSVAPPIPQEAKQNYCGVDGCTRSEAHSHNNCGVGGCNEGGAHSHGNAGGAGSCHGSEHGGGHH